MKVNPDEVEKTCQLYIADLKTLPLTHVDHLIRRIAAVEHHSGSNEQRAGWFHLVKHSCRSTGGDCNQTLKAANDNSYGEDA